MYGLFDAAGVWQRRTWLRAAAGDPECMVRDRRHAQRYWRLAKDVKGPGMHKSTGQPCCLRGLTT
jgi:hypothetical protein